MEAEQVLQLGLHGVGEAVGCGQEEVIAFDEVDRAQREDRHVHAAGEGFFQRRLQIERAGQGLGHAGEHGQLGRAQVRDAAELRGDLRLTLQLADHPSAVVGAVDRLLRARVGLPQLGGDAQV